MEIQEKRRDAPQPTPLPHPTRCIHWDAKHKFLFVFASIIIHF